MLQIDRSACTLCLACATICPLKAIDGGVDRPQLRFHADRCVQCGLCASGCPEQAISLQPLYVADPACGARPGCCMRKSRFVVSAAASRSAVTAPLTAC
ncbi:MAG: 4Fe-4S binding protein [Thiolinea sp.]